MRSVWMSIFDSSLSVVITFNGRLRVIMAISLSRRYTTLLVYSIIGEASDAMNVSLSPMPITSGELFRAVIIVSGLSESMTAIAYAPTI